MRVTKGNSGVPSCKAEESGQISDGNNNYDGQRGEHDLGEAKMNDNRNGLVECMANLSIQAMIPRGPVRARECHQYHVPQYHVGRTRRTEPGPDPQHFDDPVAISLWLSSLEERRTEQVFREVERQFDIINDIPDVSSHVTPPAQSPPDQRLTSPESVANEDNSLYSISPAAIHGELPFESTTAPNMPEDLGPAEPPSNIGTILGNLLTDSSESTTHFGPLATGHDTQARCTSERDAFEKELDPKTKKYAWVRVNQIDLSTLAQGDKDRDTRLMIFIANPDMHNRREYIFEIVERMLKENPQHLSCRNRLIQDALYLAAIFNSDDPLLASYIAEALIRGKELVDKDYRNGNTIFHCLAEKGDSHAKVLERLLKLRLVHQDPVFDVNKKNNEGFTPLHVACQAHKLETLETFFTAKVLVENGADCAAKDYKDENTPMHTLISESCDLRLLEVLCERYGVDLSPTNIRNRQGNTPLHLACGRNNLELEHQKRLIALLVKSGAKINIKNNNGCVPSVLVDVTRKQEIKKILRGLHHQ